MKLVKVKQDFIDLCKKNNVDNQLLREKDGRPGVLVVKLKYKGKYRDFVVPLRSNIPPTAEKQEYMKLPPNKNTKPGYHHGIHYIKIFPIKKEYIVKYSISKDPYLNKVKDIIDKSTKEIVEACQKILDEYENGNRHRFSVDIDGILGIWENSEKNIYSDKKFSDEFLDEIWNKILK